MHVSRTDFLARAIEASRRLASLQAYGGAESEWESALLSSGASDAFGNSGRPLGEANVVEFLTFPPDYPGSIRNCIESVEMWESS